MNKLKYLFLILPVLAFLSFNNLNTDKKQPLKQKVTENLEWHTDVKKAIAISNKEKKPLLLFFTGSDWCGWCIRLQNDVFKTPEFQEWAKKSVVLVDLDFPRRKEQSIEIKTQNSELQQVFGVRGYPTIWFVKPNEKDGKVSFEQLGSLGYQNSPTVWITSANQIIEKYAVTAIKN